MNVRRVAIIGGGISGLALAWELERLKRERKVEMEVLLFERSARLGGTIETERRDGFILEKGPDAFLSEKPWAIELCRELGLEGELIGTRDENRRSFVVKGKRLVPLPEGFYLAAPGKVREFLGTPLLSLPGKLRALLEVFVPRRKGAGDESVGDFVRRRFGREMLERIGQPMLGGIYTGDPDVLSVSATLPRFREWEQAYGSVIRGVIGSMGINKGGGGIAQSAERMANMRVSGARYGLFVSLKEGMESLVQRLARELPSRSVRVRAEIAGLDYDAYQGKWRLVAANGEARAVDAVCLAVSAKSGSVLLKKLSGELSDELASVPYESTATLNLAYKREDVFHSLDGFGFVVPKIEGRSVIACSFSSQKFEGRAPSGSVLLRAFVGGAFGKEVFQKEDKDLAQAVKRDLTELLGIEAEPVFSVLRRWSDSMVQYRVGHADWLSRVEAILGKWKGLFLLGSAYRGVGIPDCVRDAGLQAEKIMEGFTDD
ncbi:MAG: protoporphyrinogen oxidase [Candidatus Omnitrophica bacterium]|nr:protoporphyrinogen oxidase [Candidatus Omnitrophota bacterium]